MSSVDYASPQKAGAADPNAQKRNEAAGTLGFKEKLGYGLGDTVSRQVNGLSASGYAFKRTQSPHNLLSF